MALFEPFPNYVWNLSVSIALENGGRIGEIVDIIQPLMAKAQAGEDANTQDFMVEWVKMADKLTGLAEEDIAAGRMYSAGNKLKRSAIYYQTGERMQAHGSPGRAQTYDKAIKNFLRGAEPGDITAECVMLRLGRRIAVCDVRIWTTSPDRLAAQATVTYALPSS